MVTKDEAMTAKAFVEIATGSRWRRNGATKVWKTRPMEFRVPVKFGLYAYGYITDSNAHLFTVEES